MGFVVITGDMLKVTIPPPAIIPALVAPGPLLGSGTQVLVMNKPVCLMGDEMPKPWMAPMPYTAPPFTIPGMGSLKLIITPANMSKTSQAANKPMLLAGGPPMQCMFQVMTPAQMPPPVSTPDPVMVKPGIAMFQTTNVLVQAM